MKILITGGFGYVGGRLGQFFASSSINQVYLGSRIPRQRPDWLHKGEVIRIRWDDSSSLIAACKGMDVVIHTAGMNALECLKNPQIALEVNGTATERLVAAALINDLSKFVYISSAHVYSSNLCGLITEESDLLNIHPYAISNIAGEQAVMGGHSADGMQCVIIRLANSFGAPSRPDANCWMLVVNDLCRQAIENNALVIKGPSNTLRNFIGMADVCLAMQHLIYDDKVRYSSLISNLGGSTKTIFEMASAVQKIYAKQTGIKLPIQELSKPNPTEDSLDFQSLIWENMGYMPKSSFEKELTTLIGYCERNFGEIRADQN